MKKKIYRMTRADGTVVGEGDKFDLSAASGYAVDSIYNMIRKPWRAKGRYVFTLIREEEPEHPLRTEEPEALEEEHEKKRVLVTVKGSGFAYKTYEWR